MIGGPITTQSPRLSCAEWMAVQSFASRRSAYRLTDSTVILADGLKHIGDQWMNSLIRARLVTKRAQQVWRLGSELIKEISEEAGSYRRGPVNFHGPFGTRR
jgi:hypothetical protein